MNYSKRYSELNEQFIPGKNIRLSDTNIDIRFIPFVSSVVNSDDAAWSFNPADREIAENISFEYPVFITRGKEKYEHAILLMHGLNERSWNKYLTWAEYLCITTGKPVILFPIAFHMNRSPQEWTNPRCMQDVLNLRRKLHGEDRSLSFANIALSERISKNPLLFYSSGRQTVFDLEQLYREIKQGIHPLFSSGARIDIFGYSIGAFLSQIVLMSNPSGLFSDTRLFMFCGGGIFSSMYGVSRSIMDRAAFDHLYQYYLNDFGLTQKLKPDKVFDAFYSMISPDRNRSEREAFFAQMGNRLCGIALEQDLVMPYVGLQQALGTDCSNEKINLQDFPFSYTHENPFPIGAHTNQIAVNDEFNNVFSQAAGFLT